MRVPAQIVAHVEPALPVLKDAEGATPRNHDDLDAPRDRAALRLHGADVAAPRFGDGLRVTGRQRARMAGAMVGDSKRRDRREQDEPRDNGRCFHELECTGSRIPLPLSLTGGRVEPNSAVALIEKDQDALRGCSAPWPGMAK